MRGSFLPGTSSRKSNPTPLQPKIAGANFGWGRWESGGSGDLLLRRLLSHAKKKCLEKKERGRPLRANLRGHNLIPKKLPTLPHCQKIIICTPAATLIFQNVQDESRRAMHDSLPAASFLIQFEAFAIWYRSAQQRLTTTTALFSLSAHVIFPYPPSPPTENPFYGHN